MVIVTGAAKGLGRAYALMLAREGAKVVVNNRAAAGLQEVEAVIDMIGAEGGQAVADGSDISTWSGAQQLVERAVRHFGGLDALINNAGVLRDRMIINMSEAQWDDVMTVHLKGTFALTRHAAKYWREQVKSGKLVSASVINVTSHSGLYGNIGQANYSAAKAGVAAFSLVAARELESYGVRVNAIAPIGLTRMNADLLGNDPDSAQRYAPQWPAAVVTWLVSEQSRGVSGRVFEVSGDGVSVAEGWQHGSVVSASQDPGEVGEAIRRCLVTARANAGIVPGSWLNP
ncbi:SDR family NAD(P)-dependent oxidoreductase [Pseudomonas marginalis]|uniref:SDR family NAD(P)-dependent oxidoreductase n=1 Tax=Pseudomonas marginalis TaxID=298 RepID=UPI001C3F7B9A|nr:SDR family NAD(P)-dependent oxidoreductase [Pseudomonas marginalis]